jgi:hypothetical protein
MDFFFSGSKSSVVDHAQKVVAELEVALNEKDEKLVNLEVCRMRYIILSIFVYGIPCYASLN